MRRHPGRFGPAGGAIWRGLVYGDGSEGRNLEGARIYRGAFGYAPFQRVYGREWAGPGFLFASWPWQALAIVLAVAGLAAGLAWLSVAGGVMLALTLLRAVLRA